MSGLISLLQRFERYMASVGRSAAPGPNPPQHGPPQHRHKRRRKRHWKRRLRRWAIRSVALASVMLGLGLFAFAGLIVYYGADLPETSELEHYTPPQVTRILARDGTLLAESFTERRTVVAIEQIPKVMKLAVLAAEDATFYEHEGLNYFGILRALIVNLKAGRARQGGSTITQQVIKNVLLTPERTFERKIKELILARRIEQELSKEQILGLYLNRIYLGHGRYGVEEAVRYYFGKSVREVTLAEAALLAGLVKGPSIYSPRVDLARALERRRFVLEQMAEKGFAARAEVQAALSAKVVLAPPPDSPDMLAPEAVFEVKRLLESVAGPQAKNGGYTVTTTIDPKLQVAARKAIRENLNAYVARHGFSAPLTQKNSRARRALRPFEGTPKPGHRAYYGVVTGRDDGAGTLSVRVGTAHGSVKLDKEARYNPRKLRPSQFAEVGSIVRVVFVDGDPQSGRLRLAFGPESALIALDVKSAEILAMVGGYAAVRGGFNRATQAYRQPASTFKPIVYSYGIHSRALTAATILETNPATLGNYRPDNYDESEGRSPQRLREALAQSVNVAAVWALKQLGPTKVVEWAQSLGISSKLGADLSLALGAYEVSPLELAAVYTTFAAGGVSRKPTLIRRIVGPDGKELSVPGARPPRRVLTPAEAYIVTSLLRSVVTSGTAKRARALSVPIAGKTGTSNNAKDAWFAGYSPELACVVWTGFDDASPLGAGETGSGTSLPGFVAFMKAAHTGRDRRSFEEPAEGLVHVFIDPETGNWAPSGEGAIREVFLVGTEPTEPEPRVSFPSLWPF